MKFDNLTFALLPILIVSNSWAQEPKPEQVPPKPTQEESPFQEGREQRRLSPEDKVELAQYIDETKDRLTSVLFDLKNHDDETQLQMLADAVAGSIRSSFRNRKLSEVNMRIILNQALELTVGVPDSPTPGILANSQNPDLMRVILMDSIHLALETAPDDKKAIENGLLTNLPYSEVAYLRFALAESWAQATLIGEYRVRTAALQNFLDTAHRTDNARKAVIAETISWVDRDLGRLTGSGDLATRPEIEKTRFLRGEMKEMLSALEIRLQKKLPEWIAEVTQFNVKDSGNPSPVVAVTETKKGVTKRVPNKKFSAKAWNTEFEMLCNAFVGYDASIARSILEEHETDRLRTHVVLKIYSVINAYYNPSEAANVAEIIHELEKEIGTSDEEEEMIQAFSRTYNSKDLGAAKAVVRHMKDRFVEDYKNK